MIHHIVTTNEAGFIWLTDKTSVIFPLAYSNMEAYWQDIWDGWVDITSAIAYNEEGNVVAMVNNRDF